MEKSYDNIIFETRFAAEDALIHMDNIARNYGIVTLADFYDIAGKNVAFDDRKRYWSKADIDCATVLRVRNGYIINFPKPPINPKSEPSPVYISIHTLKVEDLDCTLNSVMKQVTDHPELKFYIDIN